MQNCLFRMTVFAYHIPSLITFTFHQYINPHINPTTDLSVYAVPHFNYTLYSMLMYTVTIV